MFCSRCGQKLKEGTHFCTRCGCKQDIPATAETTEAEGNMQEVTLTEAMEDPEPEAPEKAAEETKEAAESAPEEKAKEESAEETAAEAKEEETSESGVQIDATELARAGSVAAEEHERRVREAEEAAQAKQAQEAAAVNAAAQPAKKENKSLPIIIGIALAAVLVIVLAVVLIPKLTDNGRSRNRNRDKEEPQTAETGTEEPEVVAEPEPEPVLYSVEISAVDANGDLIEEVTVEIISGDTVTDTVMTSEDGSAWIDLYPGTYSLRFTKDGFSEDYENVVIGDDETGDIMAVGQLTAIPVEVEIFAQPASMREGLEGIEVTVYDGNGEEIGMEETDDKSMVSFDLIYGDYRVDFHYDGFFDETQYITVDGPDSYRQLLVPKMEDESALSETVFILLEWNGDYDLDVCLFNSALKQYVCAKTPLDEYNNFIYSDNNGVQGYELLCLRNRYKEGAQTVYVVDVENAQNWEYSPMEADGFTLKIYTEDGVDIVEPQEEQNSPAWAAFYYEDGLRHELNEYIYEETALEWTKDIKPVE